MRLDRWSERHAARLVAGLIAAYVATFTVFVTLKYRYYLYTDFDAAIFVQAVDSVLRGSAYNSIRELNWLGDHSSLVLYLAAPIYALIRHPLTLLGLQTVALGLGAVPVFRLARRELGPGVAPVGFAALYLLFPAVGYTNLYEFHPEVLCTSAMLAAFAAYRADRPGWTLAFAGLALLGKEDVALPVLALAAYALVLGGARRAAVAGGLAALAVASLALSFLVLKPALSSGEVDYGRMYLQWGSTPGEVALAVVRQPLAALGALFMSPPHDFDTVLKLQFYLHLGLPLLFLPLLSPLTALLAVPTIATHFLSWRPPQHTIYYHYTAMVTPFVFAAAVLGARRLLGGGAGRPARAAPGPAGTPAGRVTLVAALLIASVTANVLYGPLLGRGIFQFVRSEEKFAPDGRDRVLTRHRDRLLAAIGDRDSVLAGFEFLLRLADRPHTRSIHSTLHGLHTFSDRPYPVPGDVAAAVADLAHDRLRPYADRGTSGRLRELIDRNRLGLVAAAGDLLLFVRGAPDTVELVRIGDVTAPEARPVVFDGELAFLGGGPLVPAVAAGGLLPMQTFWRREAPTDSLYVLEVAAFDARGRSAFRAMRYLGYMLYPVHEWPAGAVVRESHRFMIPDDTPPGRYMLGMRVGRRLIGDPTLSEPDDPEVRAQNLVVELGPFTVTAGAGR